MAAYRLAIFDFDGTLADSLPWFMGILDDFAEAHGLNRLTPDEREALRGAPAREIVAGFGAPLWRLPAIATDMRARKATAAADIPLFEGVPQTLAGLKAAGVALAMVSSDSEANIRVTMGPAAGLIDHWDCGADIFGKARKFKRLAKAVEVPSRAVICVGDEDRDAIAAARAGMAFGAVTWGYANREILASRRPAELFERVEDLLRIAA